MSGEEITPDHIEIAIVNMTVIFSDQSFTVHFVPRRNFVPSHGWLFMMGRVKIVIEKEGAEECGVLNNRRPLVNIFSRAMFGKRPHKQERRAGIYHSENVKPCGHFANHSYPIYDERDADDVADPKAKISEITEREIFDLAIEKANHRESGADQHSTDKRRNGSS